jgi:hypothetical protein
MMFGWVFGGRDVTKVAAIIHRMCHMGRHANATFGPMGAQGVFKRHPYLVEHLPWSGKGNPHEFRFQGELEPFRFLAYDDEDIIQVFGGGEYAGLTITTTQRGSYIVSITKPLSCDIGRKAKALARVFMRVYGALDTSEFVKRGV